MTRCALDLTRGALLGALVLGVGSCGSARRDALKTRGPAALTQRPLTTPPEPGA